MQIALGKLRKNLTFHLLRLFTFLLLLVLLLSQMPVANVQAAGTDLTLIKSVEGNVTNALVGDIIRYRIHFACSNLTTPCGPMEITDVLQAGLTYVPASSSVPAGFTMTESPIGTITITKLTDLLDGSQYDAVIAVRVNYDLRPLPTTINNTVTGRIAPTGPGNWENTTPANAPPITIGLVTPAWAITKTLSSPTINPTVDTDVTYQINLCPTTTSGNVALSNISIVDTLPTGAAFVSATNSGVYAPGPGTVTWSVAGPVTPPNCVTRFVTIRYNSPTGTPPGPFNVGDNLTNSVDFDADYIPSDPVNNPCTTPCLSDGGNINHDIDPIAEIPNYSKNDTGDPIGFSGTGRFVLNLDTNDTNYPSNNLTLVDNLPAQLQVTSVTSGDWAQAFDYVRVHVEYSTNYGSSYTEFTGSPVLYNTSATFPAPVTNITNVRWSFDYDPDKTALFSYSQPGLPYTWSFGASPQIIVKPRAVATTASAPSGVSMPAAVAGNTYNNCLQTTRTNSSGTPVTDACNNETMTVQGNLVSLNASKGETPGMPWDDLSDPTISTFIPDTQILPGDTIRYTLTLELTERSSEALLNPTIQDTLPGDLAAPIGPDFVFVRNGTATLDGGAVVQPVFTQVGQVLKWSWPSLTINPLPLGSHILQVEFYGYIPRGQDPGTYTNNLYTVTDSSAVVCESGTQLADSGDVDIDTNTTEFGCSNPDNYVVERSAALRGEKWIRSISPDNAQVVDATTFLPSGACPNGGTVGLTNIVTNPFTRYPCISQAFPEGALSPNQYAPPPTDPTIDDFEYNLRVFNDGNVPMLKYVLYDILPRVGDTGSGGVLANTARGSEFRPAMTGPVQFIQGPGSLTAADFTIEYNMTINPCRPEVFDQPIGATVPGGCDNTWVLAGGVADWTLVRSYRIRLNNDGSFNTPSIANAVPAGTELRFGVPMHILTDAPPTGFDADDALSHEIAWNSFAHVGAYDKNINPPISIEDLLASEPRKVGITVPERMSVGNRIWRDADNNGTINAPDDSTPGIPNVVVNLYRDTDNNNIPDGPAIGTTTTDSEGYYLFSNIPYDSASMNNNRYIIGVPASNFNVGQPLEGLRSSTGAGNFPLPNPVTNPPSNAPDSSDHGIDPITPGLEVFSANFILQPGTEPVAETDLSNNDRDGLPGLRRGVNAERDANSNLNLDFGFFGGIDVPFSIGNHVWYDNGQTATPGVFNFAQRNDGIRQTDEPPAVGVLVQLYRDGDVNGILTPAELIRTDTTDADGFYLFDNLDPGNYYVQIAASNFTAGQPLAGWYSSQPTGTETLGVNGGATTPDLDNDDNGINNTFPEVNGIFSGVVVLTRGVPEPTGETFLSNDASMAAGFNPTAGDGTGHIGRFGELDNTSNLTIDFGFIPPMSLGNRVWIDEGAGTSPFRAGFNNALQDGTEVGVAGVTVQLWRDTNGTPGLQVTGAPPDTLLYTTTTDAAGYYLFDRLQPASNYYVHIPAANFNGAGVLVNYLSSTDPSAPADDFIDKNDNGVDNASPTANGISSPQIDMQYNTEPLTPANETDIPASTPANITAYGTNLRGLYGQADEDSNLTMDFGFVHTPRSLGNRLWIDANNNGVLDGGELPVPTGVRVSLYMDADGNGIPDDFNADTVLDGNDAIGFDLTDANGYYLFDKLPPGRYIAGVDYTNFTGPGLLVGYNSSKGSVDNAANNTDSLDNGLDRFQLGNPAVSPYGVISTSIDLRSNPVGAPTGETGSGDTSTTAGFNPTAGDGPNSRGRYGETDSNSDLTIDFGFFIPMSLGNRVFKDDGTGGGTYNNGIMDGGETPIAGVRVELWRDANTDGAPDAGGMIDFDTTDAGGYYLFDDLAPGSYVVVLPASNFTGVGPLVGYNTSTPTGTENVGVPGDPYTPNTDRDDNGLNVGTLPSTGGVRSGTITLAYTTEPIGETELSGQADPGSPANLAFSPTGWDGPNSRGRWGEADNNSNLTIDFGFIPVFSLGNRVWFDTNNNSARAGGEVGITNVRVQLFASDGTTEIPVGPDGILNTSDDATGGMLTAANGYYLFNNLPAGDYIVRIPASNFGAGQPLQGKWSSGTTISNAGVISETAAPDADTGGALGNGLDSDDNGTLTATNVDSLPVTLGPTANEPTTSSVPPIETDIAAAGQGQPDAQANMTVDFGFYSMTLGNLVWLDNGAGGGTVNDGIRNGTEAGIDGVTVQLWSQDLSTQLATTTTAGGGVYTFTGLVAGNYIVRLPASNFNSGGPLQNYRSSTGAVPPSTYEPAPNPDTTTVDSDDNGTETGGRLGAGGYVQTSAFAMTPAAEQTTTNASGLTTENRVDFGLTELVGLGNRVWFDTGAGAFTNNGVLDAGEVGVDNVNIHLFTSAGVEVPVGADGILNTADDGLGGMLTSGGGRYSFDRLLPGTYYAFIPATQFQSGGPLFTYFSTVGNSANETSDEATGPATNENGIDDAAPATNGIRSSNFALLPGTESTTDDDTGYTGALADNSVNFTDDFGFVQKYSIGNRIWLDTDNSGTINGSEVGKDGVVVNLYAASNLAVILATDTTSGGGYYLFDDLYPGDYVVSVAASNFSGAGVLTGYWSSATSRNGTGALIETTAALANSDTESDDNGTRQTAGALNGSVISSTVTLGPAGLTEPTGETDLEAVIGQGNQADGRANMTVDFGFYKLEIGNLVFADADVSGHYNAGDTLLSTVTVQLYAADGTTLITSTTTNGSGDYRFDGQPAGDYVIKVVTPTGMTSTIDTFDGPDNANPDVNTDMNDNGIGQGAGTVSSGVLTMTASEIGSNISINNATATTTDLTVDFGFVPLYSLGNRVWFDTNNNSLMDGAEVGVNGVVVDLYHADGSGNPTGAVVATDTTSAGSLGSGNGYYLFDDLFPGDYVVVIRAANFSSGGALAGYWSSATSLTGAGALTETTAPDADTVATDADDNGTLATSGPLSGAVLSAAVTLGPSGGTEPTGEVALQLESGVLGSQGNQPDDRANMTVDFGFYQVAIGNLVYLDANGNGTFDAGDSTITAATVRLYAANGSTEILVGPDGILGTADDATGGMVTSGAGIYRFAGLPAGDYIVKTVSPSGLTSTIDTFNAPDTADPDTNADNNDNGVGVGFGTISANTLTMTAGEVAANITINNATGITTDNTVDFGYIGMVAIGNRVWFDDGTGGGISNNGILDGGETGVASVRVELYTSAGVFVTFTTTDASGYYQFDQLYPGTYYVMIPATQFQTGKPLETYYSTVGNGANETSDEDVDENGIDDAAPATNGIRSPNYVLSAGTERTGEGQSNYTGVLADSSVNFTADFGFTQKYSIGNRIWFDTNNSSAINGAEVGVDGVTVNLYAASNLTVILATDTTSNGGYYLFDDLYPGDYVVSVAASNFSGAGVLTGYWSSGTSRTNPAGALTESAAALANSDTESDDNGTRQTAGALNGAVISSTVTVGPSGNTEPTLETDLETVIGQGNQADGRANMTVDFGFYKIAIGNLVFADADISGHYNAGDTTITGALVELYAADGTTLIASTNTNGSGVYSFDGQPAGDYIIKVTTPTGMTSTIDSFDSLDNANPDINIDDNDNGIGLGAGAVSSGTLTTTPGSTGAEGVNTVDDATGTTTDLTVDFGFVPLYSLGNRVWFDTNNNSLMDGAEVGVNGVVVELYAADGSGNPTGAALATDTTTGGGYYLFDDLYPGDYVVLLPASNFASGGTLAGYWSSATSLTGVGVITETAAPDGDTVATDADDNGTLSTSGAFSGAVIAEAITLGPSGGTEPTGEVASQLESGVLGNQGNQPDDRANMTVDFGFYHVEIGNLVYLDANGNGTFDAGDSAIAGVTVRLYAANGTSEIPVGPDGILGTADDATGGMVTSGAGIYRFANLPAGDYIVKTVSPTGLRSTIDTFNAADTTDPDTNADNNDNGVGQGFGTIVANTLTMTAGEVAANIALNNATGTTIDNTVDFGYIGMVAIGNRIWFDDGTGGGIFNNGILDGGEVGVSGVRVELYTSANVFVGFTTTDASGYYQFDQLYPDTYYVLIPATEFQTGKPLETYYSTIGNGTNETSDETADENGIDNAAPATNGIRSSDYVLTPGGEQTGEGQSNYTGVLADNSVNFTADFGFVHLVAIGNRVWFDNGAVGGTQNDGIQNGGEAGAPGVRVELYTSGNVFVGFTTTDASGNYQFDNLAPGQYYIHIPASEFQTGGSLEDYVSSTGNGSNNETSDQDVDENGIDAVSLPTTGINTPVYDLQPNSETTADDETSYTGYLSDDNVNFTADFGFLQKVAIGNVVWLDNGAGAGTANDGMQNGTEPGISGVDVQLYHVGDTPGVTTPVATTTTGASGYYVFDDLLPGSYFIFIPATEFQAGGTLVNLLSSTGNGSDETTNETGDENGIDSINPAATGISSTAFDLQANSEQTGEPQPNYTGALDDNNVNFTADFGFTELVALGNRVWLDTGAGAFYNNGILDAGESGVNGVTVQLYTAAGVEVPVGPDGILGTGDDAPGGVVTSAGGYYRFDRLYPGSYYVQIPSSEFTAGGDLVGYVSTLGAGANETSDNDTDENGIDVATLPTTGIRTQNYNLQPNTEATSEDQTNYAGGLDDDNVNFTADFGFVQLVSIGNRIWFDTGTGGGTPDDGIQNGGELGASGVRVELYTFANVFVGFTTTDASGNYLFDNLNPGQYYIHIPASQFQTGQPLEDYVSSTGNGSDETSDEDVDENGIDSTTLPTTGISTTVYDLQPNSETTTDDETSYTGYLDDDNINFTADLGFLQKVALGNIVWLDNGAGGGTANDGIKNGSEPGISSVDIQLYHVGDVPGVTTPVSATTTDASGYYVFDNLLPGDYFIYIPPTEFQSSGTLASYLSSTGNGSDETTNETGDENGIDDAAPATNGIRSTNYTLQPNSEQTGEPQPNYTGALDDDNVNFTADLGFVEKYSLGNRVWFDTNNDGLLNGSEVGVAGVTVELYAADGAGNPTGAALQTDTTVVGGYYLFDDLYGGDYVVVIPAAELGVGGTLEGYWSSGTTRSPAGIVSEITAPDADTTPTDSDDNGTLQTGGAFTGAVLSQAVTLGPTGTTEPTGETDLEAGLGQGSAPDGRANMTVDFGFYTMTLGNLVWSDTDKNGAFNGGETGTNGVAVELWSGDGTTQIATGTTAGGGLYTFIGLPQGDYIIHVIAPTGTNSSVDSFAPTDTTNPTTNTDNNDNGVGTGSGTIVSNPVTLTPGDAQTSNTVDNATGSTTNPTLDFGFTPVFSLGNRVWFDTDNSGTINGAEVGINGVTVNLYAASDLTTIIGTQVTANGGYYLFNGLYAGDYVVSVDSSNFSGVLSGYWSSATSRTTAGALTETTAATANSDVDSDDNGTLQTSGALNGAVISSTITLGPALTAEPGSETDTDATLPGNQQGQPDAQANMTVDFGFYTMTLGDIVWNDLDNSGLLDGAEVGIDGVTVQLWSGDGSTLLGTTTTSGGGLYSFVGLPTGDYIVRLPAVNFNPAGVLRDYRSSTGPLPAAYEPAPDADSDTTNSDDNGSETNGLLGLGGYIQTLPVTLTPASEESFSDAAGSTLESRVDFGVNNSPQIDLTVTKTDNQSFYQLGGTLTYTIVVTNNGPADANGMTVSDARPAQITSWTWTCASGTPAGYNCTDDLTNPATFTDTLDLPQLASVTYTVVAQVDPAATGDLTNSVTVTPPPGLTDLTPPDNTATDIDKSAAFTITKDDGVQIVAPGATLTYTITVTNTGASDLTGILVKDTIPTGTNFVSATGGGTNLAGVVTWPSFDLAVGASTQRQVVVTVADEATLKGGNITSLTNTVIADDDGSHTGKPIHGEDDDTDQILISNVKGLTGTNQPDSTGRHVLIGEILTYSIKLDIPAGTITNLKAVDVLDHGLAFVGCETTNPITSTGLTLQHDPCADPAYLKVQAMPTSDTNPKSENAGRKVTFTFGQVDNTSGATQSLIVSYRVVVLNIKDNADGTKNLNNKAVWSWEGGSLTGDAPDVDIVEPDLSIEKTVDHKIATIGSMLTFQIAVEHTTKTHAPAYDVLVTDALPLGLALDSATIKVKNSSGLPTPVIKPTGNTFTVYWSAFPMGEKAVITFQAKFVGPAPVINKTNVVWTSLPGTPKPPIQSDYNDHSDERTYDPLDDTLNDYIVDSSVEITTPAKLPNTGFAPGVQTVLPLQPLDKAYDALGDLWMEIPALGLKMPIVGVPGTADGWDLTWLSNQAGYLEGTTYPTQVGTTGLTGHVYLADGTPGPFIHLANLVYGNQIILHANGKRYIYEVRTNRVVLPTDTSVFKNDGYTWLTLLTCKDYIPSLNRYDYRLAVRAVLISVVDGQ